MVTRQTHTISALDTEQVNWISLLTDTNEAGRALIATVAQWRKTQSATRADWDKALAVAELTVQLHLDADAVAAALLLGIDSDNAPVDASVHDLVRGVNQLASIGQWLMGESGQNCSGHNQAENLRQMLLAMASDIRVVLIKLAERLQSLREATQHGDEEFRELIAHEAQQLYAPLANRLGVWQIKWEMEDLSYRILEPDNYQRIARLLDEKYLDREHYIADVVSTLRLALQAEGVVAEVTGRPKHIVSIINKMLRKHLDFDELYDIRAVRILVPELKDCYAALGVVHHAWPPISGEFDDYIAHPKSNNYRSLHTGVIGPDNKAIEVQIRTFAMHQHAELGVAAHWRYKEGQGKSDDMIAKVAWLRQILQWKDAMADGGELAALFKNELFQDRIYVLTPQGRVIDLETGASPVDFAYHVHTDLGHRCRGAKIDGIIVPLNTPLKNGQRVEILTVKQGGPSRDWLNPALGYLVTARARVKARHWFRVEHFSEHVAQGRDVLERELRRMHARDINLDKLAAKLGVMQGDELFAALGRGDVGNHQLAAAIQSLTQVVTHSMTVPPRSVHATTTTNQEPRVLIEGLAGLPVTLARCCHPAPPASIVAYATQGRGLSIHRRACANITRVDATRKDRLLAAAWQDDAQLSLCKITVEAFDRQGLLRDVSGMLTQEKISVVKVNTESRGDIAMMHFHVRTHPVIERALARIRGMDDVLQVTIVGQ